MDEPDTFFDQLIDLTADLDDPGAGITADLRALTVSLSEAVSSYRGLELTVVSRGCPLVLTTFTAQPGAETSRGPRGDDPGFTTSLRVPLTLLGKRFETGGQVVLYADRAEAFRDLAADLAGALGTRITTEPPPGTEGPGHDDADTVGPDPGVGMPVPSHGPASADSECPGIVLDGNRAPTTSGVVISGLAELRDVNRAAGMMIANGCPPGEVHAKLRRDAADAGLNPPAYAVRLLTA